MDNKSNPVSCPSLPGSSRSITTLANVCSNACTPICLSIYIRQLRTKQKERYLKNRSSSGKLVRSFVLIESYTYRMKISSEVAFA